MPSYVYNVDGENLKNIQPTDVLLEQQRKLTVVSWIKIQKP